MAVEVILPKVDMVMESGTFLEWLKKDGQQVIKGEPLFTIETDKASIEVEAPATGILAGVRAKAGDVIPVSETIAYILAPGESQPPARIIDLTTDSRDQASSSAAAPVTVDQTPEGRIPTKLAIPGAVAQAKVRASPVARRMATELGVDLASLSGRGPRGRIQRADVVAASQMSPAFMASATPMLQIPLPEARRKEVIPLRGARKIIAQRMAYSAATAPHITLSAQVDMGEVTRMRTRLQAQIERTTGHHLSFTAILARMVAAVLPRHPFVNASLNGEEIICWEDVHLGIATSLKDYLIVPVIREAQTKSLAQIVTTLANLLERARSRRLVPAEMSGSTFTISNLGMFGIESFTAIINPPESAILAVGQIVQRQIIGEGGVTTRPMMNLTLSADHRVLDGVAAARFLADLKATLEDPYLLL